jgi:ankyrin repeat protein
MYVLSQYFVASLAIIVGLILTGCNTGKQMPDTSEFFKDPLSLEMARAIEAEDVEQVKILAGKLDINARYHRGMIFLMWAYAQQQFSSFQALLVLGADPAMKVEGSFLWDLAMMNHVRWTKALVEAGIDLNQKDDGQPVWFSALSARNWPVLDYLLEHGLEINAQDSVGKTAIMLLAGSEQYDQVMKLLEREADITPATSIGSTFAYKVQYNTVPKNNRQYPYREQVIKILKRKGVRFPVPSPRELRERKERSDG